jgi:hypothetical protein
VKTEHSHGGVHMRHEPNGNLASVSLTCIFLSRMNVHDLVYLTRLPKRLFLTCRQQRRPNREFGVRIFNHSLPDYTSAEECIHD